jgi:hypothetical protein
MRYSVLLSISLALLRAPFPARADEDDANALLRRGVGLRREHRNQEALETFMRALAISPTPIARAQVAMAEQALGHWLDAERDLAAALDAADDAWVAKSRPVLEEARTEIERHLAWLTVDVDVTTVEVQIDGRTIAARSEERVVSGQAVLEVRANGYVSEVRRLELAARSHARVAVALAPVVAQPVPPLPVSSLVSQPPPYSDHEAPSFAFPYGPTALTVIGAAGIGVGTYFGLHALDEKKARDAQCVGGTCAPPALTEDADARTSATVSTAAVGTGLALLVGGATWWVVDKRRVAMGTSHSRTGIVGPAVLGTLGLASIGTAIYFGLHANADKDARDAQCSRNGCVPAAFAYDADARTSAALSTVAWSAGLGLLAAGAVMWTIDHSPHGWHASPRVGPHVGGVIVQKEFE